MSDPVTLTDAQVAALHAICTASEPSIGAKVSNRTDNRTDRCDALVYWQTARSLAALGLAQTHLFEQWIRLTDTGRAEATRRGFRITGVAS